MSRKVKRIFVDILCASINAQITSLLGRLNDYDWLYVSQEDYDELDKIERQLHDLSERITTRRNK